MQPANLLRPDWRSWLSCTSSALTLTAMLQVPDVIAAPVRQHAQGRVEHGARHDTDVAGALGERDELGRRHKAALRMAPAHQRLHAQRSRPLRRHCLGCSHISSSPDTAALRRLDNRLSWPARACASSGSCQAQLCLRCFASPTASSACCSTRRTPARRHRARPSASPYTSCGVDALAVAVQRLRHRRGRCAPSGAPCRPGPCRHTTRQKRHRVSAPAPASSPAAPAPRRPRADGRRPAPAGVAGVEAQHLVDGAQARHVHQDQPHRAGRQLARELPQPVAIGQVGQPVGKGQVLDLRPRAQPPPPPWR